VVHFGHLPCVERVFLCGFMVFLLRPPITICKRFAAQFYKPPQEFHLGYIHGSGSDSRICSDCTTKRNFFLLVFLVVALLFDGVSRVFHGISDRSSHRASRIFSIVAGAIEIGLSVMIIASPVLGAEILGFLISLSLLIVGIQMITSGVIGRRLALPT
jgi:uncharacterized membrane protein HdeD (DUF308 family)